MKVVEIFKSIEGEGRRAGLPAVFIRLYGCNLNCTYCDTRYGCEGGDYELLTIPEILDRVEDLNCKNVTITGGEPLLQGDLKGLISELLKRNYWINIETNGSLEINDLPCNAECFLTMDYKCPSSGMESSMNINNFLFLDSADVLKFVVGTQEDLDRAYDIIKKFNPEAQIYFSPVFGKMNPEKIVDFIISKGLNNCKVQLQLHKIIWDPNKRGV
jgi:7-carboxy-7-deazaguanine synthase